MRLNFCKYDIYCERSSICSLIFKWHLNVVLFLKNKERDLLSNVIYFDVYFYDVANWNKREARITESTYIRLLSHYTRRTKSDSKFLDSTRRAIPFRMARFLIIGSSMNPFLRFCKTVLLIQIWQLTQVCSVHAYKLPPVVEISSKEGDDEEVAANFWSDTQKPRRRRGLQKQWGCQTHLLRMT